jgi:hypothetical protein
MYQMVALLIAWTVLLAATGLIDELFNFETHPILIGWLCVGIGIMLIRKIDFPLPAIDRVDVPGAFTMLWWAAFWPRYLSKT